eukprot:COSAG01_NODE_2572_length_7436_cov_3.363500_3_plen_80_part_00
MAEIVPAGRCARGPPSTQLPVVSVTPAARAAAPASWLAGLGLVARVCAHSQTTIITRNLHISDMGVAAGGCSSVAPGGR